MSTAIADIADALNRVSVHQAAVRSRVMGRGGYIPLPPFSNFPGLS